MYKIRAYLEGLHKQGISDLAVENQTGVPQPTVQRIRTGVIKKPGLDTIRKLVEGMGAKIDDIREDVKEFPKPKLVLSPPEQELIKAMRSLPKSEILRLATIWKLVLVAYGPHVSDKRLRDLGWAAPTEKA